MLVTPALLGRVSVCAGYCGQVSDSVAISRASTCPSTEACSKEAFFSFFEGTSRSYNTASSRTGKRTGGRAQTMAGFSKARCIKTGGKGTKLQSGAQVTRDNGQVTPGVVSRQQAPVPDSGHPGAVKSESKRRSHVRNPPPPPLGRTGSLAPESLNR